MPLKFWLSIGGALAVLALVSGLYFKGRHDEAAKWRPKLEASQLLAKQWRAYGLAEKQAFLASEKLRAEENTRAQAALQQANDDCAGRVSRARKSALSIRGIITKEPRYDQNHCVVRELVPSRELHNALTPADR